MDAFSSQHTMLAQFDRSRHAEPCPGVFLFGIVSGSDFFCIRTLKQVPSKDLYVGMAPPAFIQGDIKRKSSQYRTRRNLESLKRLEYI